jgi:type I restriction enzyme S subunit
VTLPKRWAAAELRSVCDLLTDGTHHSPANERSGAFPYITAKNVKWRGVDVSDLTYVSREEHETIYRRCPVEVGDILLIKDGATTGIAAINELSYPFSMLSSVALIRPTLDILDNRYLWYWIRSPQAQNLLLSAMNGSAIRRLTLTTIGRTVVPLPPTAEQRRIVAKLDALSARLARARVELDQAHALTTRMRMAASAAAFTGKLNRNQRNGADADWEHLALGSIADVITGSTPPTAEKSQLFGGDVPFFKPTDLDAGYHVERPRESLSPAGALRSRIVPAGTTLVTCIGATIGKTGFARVACAFNQQINGVVPRSGMIEPTWFYWAITSPQFHEKIIDNSSATTMPIINKSRFQALKIPVPPLSEQVSIVRQLEGINARADRFETEAARASTLLDRLESAILAKAFRGELVPQDPNDEPASVLLKRVHAMCATAPKPKRNRRTKSGPLRPDRHHPVADVTKATPITPTQSSPAASRSRRGLRG